MTGEEPVSCAVADLMEVAAGRLDDCFRPETGFAGFGNASRAKPWIAAVNGPALAGSCETALACDIIVVNETVSFGLPEVRRGLIASAGGLYHLPRIPRRTVALELVLTGERLPAKRALALGMVNGGLPGGRAGCGGSDHRRQRAACGP